MICPTCDIKLKIESRCDKHVYYIGNDKIHFKVNIATASCRQCYKTYEVDDVTTERGEAMMNAIDQYWESKFLNMGVNIDYLKAMRSLIKKLINNDKSKGKTRLVSQELGLWLAGQHFI